MVPPTDKHQPSNRLTITAYNWKDYEVVEECFTLHISAMVSTIDL